MVVFRDALLTSLICPFVIFFILYWVETTQYSALVQIRGLVDIYFLTRGIRRSYLFLEHYVTVIDKNHNRTGKRPNLRKFPNILAASGLLVKSHISV